MKSMRFPYLIIILTIGIVLGIQIEKIFSGDSLRDGIRKLNDVLTYTEKYYVEEIDTPKLVEAAINGMLGKLDPHSVYISPEQFSSVEESFRGDFEGIGIEFQIINDTLIVVSPITGGPSEALGIMSGDRIVKIDGEDIVGITNEGVRSKLRGKAGTKVNITIARSGIDREFEYQITRDKIPLYSVDTHFMYDDLTGYVSASRFSETTFDELESALHDLKNKGMQQLILDLRGNPGGYLNQAVKIADLFIDGKKKIVYTEGRRSEFNEEYFSSRDYPFEKVPIIVLINRGSASASEIVSGAIQDWDRGLVVGETSFGKGLVQRQFTLPDNSALRLTISSYYTPSGRGIQRDYKNKKDKKEYYSELSEFDEAEGENINHTAEEDSLRPVFKTNKGRTVYGGGGITPDYIVKADTISGFTRDLLRNNVFYQFVLSYLDKNSEIIIAKYGDDLSYYKSDFQINESQMREFLNFAKSKDIELVDKEYQQDKEYLKLRLKAQIARNFWKSEGWYSILLTSDNQMNRALTLFDEAKSIANL